MSDLKSIIHRNIIRDLVSRDITCPTTGEVLDVRTCVVLLDGDGDPRIVISQAGWQATKDSLLQTPGFIRGGWTVDKSTIKAPVSKPACSTELNSPDDTEAVQYLAADRIIELKISPEPTNAHAPNGYGGKLATSMLLKLDDNRWRRVYAMAYGNWFSAYVIVGGIDHVLSAEADIKITNLKTAARAAWEAGTQ